MKHVYIVCLFYHGRPFYIYNFLFPAWGNKNVAGALTGEVGGTLTLPKTCSKYGYQQYPL
jgi:hypothetical protein